MCLASSPPIGIPANIGIIAANPSAVVDVVSRPNHISVGICANDIAAKNIEMVAMNSSRFNLIAFRKLTAIGADIPAAPCRIPAAVLAGNASFLAEG